MDPSDWSRVRDLFEQALNKSPAERDAFLAIACSDRPDLLAEVNTMLVADAHAQQSDTSLGAAAPELLKALSDEEAVVHDALAGLRLGPWRLLREIGRGGMGAVYLADRDDGEYVQQAAIKLVRPGWDVGELLQRFRGERQILATLNHPNIARLLDGGVSDDGKPYLVLEYVQGSEIGRYCNALQLSIDARLRLFLTVCDAVTHAHRRLVVHRDLKPSNILVDGSGQVKLLDFGIAKLLQGDASITASASRMFTPEYAAPEQVRGELVTTGVDVYALGLLLFELLTGRRPYGATASTPAAYEQAILTQEAQKPSRAVMGTDAELPAAERAAARSTDPSRLSALLRGDLDAIVLKALRKEPEQRYSAVADFAADVQRHLDRQPVTARRGNVRYRLMRFVQRHALATSLVTIAALSLVGGLGVALWQAEQARRQRDLARTEASNASEVAKFVTGVFSSADPRSTDGYNPRAKELLAKGVAELDARTDLQPATRSALLTALGHAHLGVSEYKQGLQLMQRAHAAAEQGESVRTRVEAQFGLGLAYNKNHQNEQALVEYQHAHNVALAHPEIDRILIENLEYMIGLELYNLNQADAALPYLQRTYEARATRLDAASEDLVSAMAMYAFALTSEKRFDEALRITAASYAAMESQPGLPVYRRKDIVSARAYPLLQLERFAEAESMYREALRVDELVFGAGDERTTVSLNNLGICLSRQNRFKEAAAIMQRVLTIRRARNNPDDPEVAFSLVNIGNILLKDGAAQPAIDHFREALLIYAHRNEQDHRQSIKGRFGLASALEAQGEHGAALRHAEDLKTTAVALGAAYLYAKDAGPDLLYARLLARLDRMPSDCAPMAAVLAMPDATTEAQLEARILAAHCASRNGRTEEAQIIRRALPTDPAAFAGVSAFALGLER